MTDTANILGVNHLCPKCNINTNILQFKDRAQQSRDLVKTLMDNDKDQNVLIIIKINIKMN